jgi:hypothetical protein
MGQSGVKLARGGIVLGGELVPRAWLVSLALALSCLPDIAPQPPDPSAPAAACVTSEDCGLRAACGGRSCIDGRCQLDNEVAGTPCDEDGGRLCNGAGHCVECTLDNDCAVAEVCMQQRCAPTLCTNGAQDGTETDVDCGGDDCPRCANGLGCFDGGDCVSLAVRRQRVCAELQRRAGQPGRERRGLRRPVPWLRGRQELPERHGLRGRLVRPAVDDVPRELQRRQPQPGAG